LAAGRGLALPAGVGFLAGLCWATFPGPPFPFLCSCCFVSEGAEANALVASPGVLPAASEPAGSGGAAGVACLAALPFGQAKLSAPPGVAAIGSTFAPAFTAVPAPPLAPLP